MILIIYCYTFHMLLYYRHGKYMACCLLYRGDVVPKVTGMF
jgi:hypothetical protein